MTQFQHNLISLHQIRQFYNDDSRILIDIAMTTIVFLEQPFYGMANYKGIRYSNGTPRSLNAARIYLINNRKIYEVFSAYKETAEVKKIRDNYIMPETMVSALMWINNRFENRANLVRPQTNLNLKGLFNISEKNAKKFPDFSNNIANFDNIPTSTPVGLEPANSIYNTWASIERAIISIASYTDTLISLAKKKSVSATKVGQFKVQLYKDRKYPIAGWMIYLIWTHGVSEAITIYNAYVETPDITIAQLPKNIYLSILYHQIGPFVSSGSIRYFKDGRNVSYNKRRRYFSADGITNTDPRIEIETVESYVERVRMAYNVGQYLACNNCIARAFKDEIINQGGVVIGNKIERKYGITCTPLDDKSPLPKKRYFE